MSSPATARPAVAQPLVVDLGERRRSRASLDNKNRLLEEQVAARTLELAAVNQELDAFAYSISHDLRAPLRGIDGFSQALLEDYSDSLDEVGRSYLHRLRASAQRMALMIDDMHTLSMVGRGALVPAAVDLGLLAREAIADLRRLEPEREVTVVAPDGLMARADQRLMRIVVTSLIGNAWKFTAGRETAEIEIGVSLPEGERSFFVRDNGAGFDMRYASRLFAPFQRLHTEADFAGNGIGLATVKRIIRRHGGSVRAEGVPDHGATIHFTLPEQPDWSDDKKARRSSRRARFRVEPSTQDGPGGGSFTTSQ